MAAVTASSSPITQVSQSPITQVSQAPSPSLGLQPQLLSRMFLDLRGRRFEVDRETVMNLPESVLLCLFPNGLALSRQSRIDEDEEDEEVYGVDVSIKISFSPLLFLLAYLWAFRRCGCPFFFF